MDDDTASRLTFLRRRAAGAVVVLLVIAGAAALLSSSGSSSSGLAGRSRTVATPAPARVVRAPRPAPSTAQTRLASEVRAVEQVRQRMPFVAGGGGHVREVALTFDDGPGPYTPAVLDALDREHAPATFFVVTQMLRYFKPALQREVLEGYAIGDHTASHPLLARLARDDQIVQVDGAAAALEDAGTPHTVMFRPPYGSYNATTRKILERQHLLGVLWNVDARDFARPGTDTIVRTVLENARAGSIVEMHDAGGDRTETVAALPKIIRGLRRRGYRLVTVPRLMLDDPPSGPQKLPPGAGEEGAASPAGAAAGP